MRELLRRGLADTPGMDELARRIWQRRAEITRRHRLDGTLQQVRELLDKALQAERRALFSDPDDDARFREAQLDALPQTPPVPSTAGRRVEPANAQRKSLSELARAALTRYLLLAGGGRDETGGCGISGRR